MVVKNGYAHITFHKKVHEQETMKKLQGTEFMRKRLFFKRTVNESGNEMEDENFEIPENQ